MTKREKEDYSMPRSFALKGDDLDDVAAGLGTPDSMRIGRTSIEEGPCVIGGSARGDCGTGLQATVCRAGGSPEEGCRNGRVP